MLDLTGQNVAILGAGRSGLAAAKLASRCGALVTVFDSRGPEVFTSFPEELKTHANATAQAGETDEQTSRQVSTSLRIRDRFVSFKLSNQKDPDDQAIDRQHSGYDDEHE